MIPTLRLYGLLVAGLVVGCLMAALVNLNTAFLFLLVFDIAVLILAFVDSRRVAKVEASRQPSERLSIGRDNVITLVVRSQSQLARLQIRDSSPFPIPETPLELDLRPQSVQELTYTVRPTERGTYDLGAIYLRQLGPWGLAWRNWKVEQKSTVAIYPDLLALRELSIKLALQNTGTLRQSRRFATGTEFAEMREYSPGDDPRLIDWKATARTSRPLVRVLEPEQDQTLIILLDRGRLMTAQVAGLKRFDHALNTTLALALAAIGRGDRVGVGVFDKQMHTWIAPERGQKQMAQLLAKLTPIQPELIEPDYIGAVTRLTSQQSRRALVVLLTDLIDLTASAELLVALGRLTPRYRPFCVTLRDPRIDQQAQQTSNTLETAYNRAVAIDLLAQRQVALAQLKQRGVLVLDAPANQISSQLVDRYLRLKARNQL
jgi:uncharacterized protein (DUF58 family)